MERFYKWINRSDHRCVHPASAIGSVPPPSPDRQPTQHEILHEDQLPGRISAPFLAQVEPYGRLTVARDTVRVPMFRIVGPVETVNDSSLRAFGADCVQHAQRMIGAPAEAQQPLSYAIGTIRRWLKGNTCKDELIAIRERLWKLAENANDPPLALLLEAAGDAAGKEAWAAARYASERALWAVAGSGPGQCMHAQARDTERRWQNRRFVAYIYGCLPAAYCPGTEPTGLAQRPARSYL